MKSFPLANGVPMHLLSELGLHEAFVETVERHRRDGLPLVLNRTGAKSEFVPAEELGEKLRSTRARIAELDAEIAHFRKPFSLNEPPAQTL